MELIKIFTWTITTLLGITFVFSLLALAQKSKDITPKKYKKIQ